MWRAVARHVLGHGRQGRQQPVRGQRQQGLRLHSHYEGAELLQLAWSGQLGGGEEGVSVQRAISILNSLCGEFTKDSQS